MDKTKHYFSIRAKSFNQSSNWAVDHDMIRRMFELSEAGPKADVLDIATGTGLVAKEFLGKVNKVVGIDISHEMYEHAKGHMDEIHFSSVEKMPFEDNSFDVCVCRQGLQYVNLDKAVSEIHRVLKPGGTVVLCHLTAYGDEDKEFFFKVQKLRNPSRKNYFVPNDFPNALKEQGFKDIQNFSYISDESVNKWINNGIASEEDMEWIKNMYNNAPKDFMNIHKIRYTNGDIIDSMLFSIVKASK